jgi:hypothetical protein
MYVGHYFAWITAGIMYAVQLQEDPENTSVAPGPIAKLVGVRIIPKLLFEDPFEFFSLSSFLSLSFLFVSSRLTPKHYYTYYIIHFIMIVIIGEFWSR